MGEVAAGGKVGGKTGAGGAPTPADPPAPKKDKKDPKPAAPKDEVILTAEPGTRGKLGVGVDLGVSTALQKHVIFMPKVRLMPKNWGRLQLHVDVGLPLRFFQFGDNMTDARDEFYLPELGGREEAERLLAQPNATEPTGPTDHQQGAIVHRGKRRYNFGAGAEVGAGLLYPWGRQGWRSRVSSGLSLALGAGLFRRSADDSLVELQFETPESIRGRTCDDPDAFGGTGDDCTLPTEDPVLSDFTLRGSSAWLAGATVGANATVVEARLSPSDSIVANLGVERIITAEDDDTGFRGTVGYVHEFGPKPFKSSRVEKLEIATFKASAAEIKAGEKIELQLQFKTVKPDRVTIQIVGPSREKLEFTTHTFKSLADANKFLADTKDLLETYAVRVTAERDGQKVVAETGFTVVAEKKEAANPPKVRTGLPAYTDKIESEIPLSDEQLIVLAAALPPTPPNYEIREGGYTVAVTPGGKNVYIQILLDNDEDFENGRVIVEYLVTVGKDNALSARALNAVIAPKEGSGFGDLTARIAGSKEFADAIDKFVLGLDEIKGEAAEPAETEREAVVTPADPGAPYK